MCAWCEMLAAPVAKLLMATCLPVMHVDTLEKDVREPSGFRCCIALLLLRGHHLV